MTTTNHILEIAGYIAAGAGILACFVTPFVLFAIFSHKHIPESTLQDWDKNNSL